MVEENDLRDVFTDAIAARDELKRSKANAALNNSNNPDHKQFANIATLVAGVIYRAAEPSTLSKISGSLVSISPTRENFSLIEDCFVCLYNTSKDRKHPERSRDILNRAIDLLALIGRNGFDVSIGTQVLLSSEKHPLANADQISELSNALRKCMDNSRSFMGLSFRAHISDPPRHSGKVRA